MANMFGADLADLNTLRGEFDRRAEAAIPSADDLAAQFEDFLDDLFSDDVDDFVDFEPPSLMDRLRARLPMRIIAIAAAALVALLHQAHGIVERLAGLGQERAPHHADEHRAGVGGVAGEDGDTVE